MSTSYTPAKGDFVKITTTSGGSRYLGTVGIVMSPDNVTHEDPTEHSYLVWFGPQDQAPFYRDELEVVA